RSIPPMPPASWATMVTGPPSPLATARPHEPLEAALEAVGHPARAELRRHARPTLDAKPLAELGLARDPPHGLRDEARFRGRQQQARALVLDDLARPSTRHRYRRDPAGHRLEQNDAERLRVGGVDEHVH